MTKEQWKWYYRQLRIARRESWKVCLDVMIFGAGAVRFDGEHIAHVPIQDLRQ